MKPVGLGIGVFTPMKKDGNLYLVNTSSKSILTNGPIDAYEDCLNSAGFVIEKDGKKILVDLLGNIMSEPTTGSFYWEWDHTYRPTDDTQSIIIKNEKLPNVWLINGRTGAMTEISTQ